ncbi:transposase family protein [Streptomyces mirabilis]|uniref:transposase family protein n=1 Tax=Streptomyces mirabilis TaxID=68239 RepID=UPI00331DBB36
MPSALIGVPQRHCEDVGSACPDPEPPQLTSLAEALGRIPDPRRVRGRRYRLGSLLGLCLVAVLGGATSLAAIARCPRRHLQRGRFADGSVRSSVAPTSAAPSTRTI